ncbi:MAG TPA: porin family protein [Gammaproteobacteria bacterium]|nr:porin family protein [Gammaproteobacteria bacterium]
MRIIKRTMLILGMLFVISPLAMAAGEYAGGQWAMMNYDLDSGSGDADMTVAVARYGMNWKNNVDFEARFGLGLTDDSVGITTVDTNYILGGYVVGRLPVANKVELYGMLGLTYSDLSVSITGLGSADDSGTDISYGFGADYEVNAKWKANLEYMFYADTDGGELTALSLGASYSF